MSFTGKRYHIYKFISNSDVKVNDITSGDEQDHIFIYNQPKVCDAEIKDIKSKLKTKITGITSKYFSQFGYLEKLYLSNNRLTELNPVDLNISNGLTRLDVEHNDIAVLEKRFLHGILPIWNLLKMSSNSLSEFNVAEISSGQGLPSLLHLHLFGNDLTNMPQTDLLPIEMETLDVGGNKITHIPDGYFSSFQNLTSLNLDGLSMTNLPDFTIAMQYLEELVLSNNDFVQLNSSGNFFMSIPVLKRLDLRYNSLTILNEGSLYAEKT